MDGADERTGADGWTGGRTDRRRTAVRVDVGQRRGGRANRGQMGGRTDERTGRRQGGLAVVRTGGRAGGLKGPAPHSPLHSRAPRLLTSLQSEFAGRLGVHWGPSLGYVILFFAPNNIFAIQAQHYCEVCARIVLALSRIVTRIYGERERSRGSGGISRG